MVEKLLHNNCSINRMKLLNIQESNQCIMIILIISKFYLWKLETFRKCAFTRKGRDFIFPFLANKYTIHILHSCYTYVSKTCYLNDTIQQN